MVMLDSGLDECEDTKRPIVARLVVPAQLDQPKRVFAIRTGKNIVSKYNPPIAIQHEFVSGEHAMIVVEDGEHWLVDLASTNGTFLGATLSHQLQPKRFYQLSHGKQIRFGRVLATYQLLSNQPSSTNAASTPKTNVVASTTNLSTVLSDRSHADKRNSSRGTEEKPFPTDTMEAMETAEDEDASVEAVVPSQQAANEENHSPSVDEPAWIVNTNPSDVIPSVGDHRPLPNENKDANAQVDEDATQMEDPISPRPIAMDAPQSPTFPSVRSGRTNGKAAALRRRISEDSDEEKRSERGEVVPVERQLPEEKESPPPNVAPERKRRGRPPKKVKLEAELEPNADPTTKAQEQRVELEKEAKENAPPLPLTTAIRGKKRMTEKTVVTSSASKEITTTTTDDSAEMRVTMTALDEKYEAKLKRLGTKVVPSWNSCTHLVTNKIRRTTKFLCALAAGKKIVSVDWVDACVRAKKLLDTDAYPLQDPATEERFEFRLEESMQRVAEHGPRGLLKGRNFFITPSTKPDYEDLQEIIQACGGEVLADLPFKHDDETLIVTCPQDRELLKECSPAWSQQMVSTEFILAGALKQKLDFDSYRLTKFGSTPMKVHNQ